MWAVRLIISGPQMPDNARNSLIASNGWKAGQSGNPLGRPKAAVDINALCRKHGPLAVVIIKRLMDHEDPRIQLAAATAILDRGFGKPAQAVSIDGASAADLTLLHLLAARMLHDAAQPTLEAKVVADETTAPPDLYAPASE